MATKYYTGRATAVAQVSSVTITAYDASTTYIITIGGVQVTRTGTGGTTTTTATAFATALNNSTHPYFAAITWSSSGAAVLGTADTAGVPFTATASVSGGAGTIGSFSNTTNSDGPAHLDSINNWSDGSLPGNNDTIIIADISSNIFFGLDQLTATGLNLRVHQSFLGKIGLAWDSFATDATGTVLTTATEYRARYFQADFATIEVGEFQGPTTPAGSTRLKIRNDRPSSSTWLVYRTHVSGENNKPALRALNDDDDGQMYIQSAAGGVGLAADEPGETSNIQLINISDTTSSTRVLLGQGVNFKASTGSWIQSGGTNSMASGSTLALMEINGGTLTTFGSFAITSFTQRAGTVLSNNTGGITTVHLYGGELNGLNHSAARTWGTVNLYESTSAVLKADDWITITTLNEPTGRYGLQVTNG